MSVINSVAATGGKSEKNKIFFLRKGRFEAMSLAQLDALAAQLVERFIAAGFQRGQRIGILAANTIEWVLLDIAAIKAGLVIAGFDFGRFNSVRQLVNMYNLKGIYADIAIDHTSACNVRPLVEEVLEARSASTAAAVAVPPRYAADDYTTIKFTSGSTGLPKGLCASVGSSLASVQ
jgi:long-chain acyl-CoA synthetase